MITKSPINVCAALLVSREKILIARRNSQLEQGDLWEFPGGKIEAGESPQQCLVRELKEELGLDITVGDFFAESVFSYPEKTIQLSAWWVFCEAMNDSAHTIDTLNKADHSKLCWVSFDQLEQYEMSPADIPFVNKLCSMKEANHERTPG